MLSDSPKLAITVATKRARLDARRGCASSTALNCADKRRHAFQLSVDTVIAACHVFEAGSSSCRHLGQVHRKPAAYNASLQVAVLTWSHRQYCSVKRWLLPAAASFSARCA